MNSIQRFNALLAQQPPDKVPIRVGNYNVLMTHYYRMSIGDYLENPGLNAEHFVRMVREFELDSIKPGLGYILYGCGPEMGPVWQFPEDNFPAAVKGVIDSDTDIDRVRIPSEPQGYFRNFLEINRRVKDAIGNQTHLGVSILGPFSCAAFLRGYENLLVDMVQDPGFFSRIMEKAVEVSTFIGRHCLGLGFGWTNLLEIFLIPGMVSPDAYHRLIAPHCDAVRNRLSDPPIPNSNAAFMGSPGNPESYRDGKHIYEYYFGTAESLEVIREASRFMLPGFPRLVSLSGNALVHWPIDEILDFIRRGLDFFVHERREYPCIFLPSLQSEGPDQAPEVAEKLRTIADFRNGYQLVS